MFTLHDISSYKEKDNKRKNLLIGAGIGGAALLGLGAGLALKRGKLAKKIIEKSEEVAKKSANKANSKWGYNRDYKIPSKFRNSKTTSSSQPPSSSRTTNKEVLNDVNPFIKNQDIGAATNNRPSNDSFVQNLLKGKQKKVLGTATNKARNTGLVNRVRKTKSNNSSTSSRVLVTPPPLEKPANNIVSNIETGITSDTIPVKGFTRTIKGKRVVVKPSVRKVTKKQFNKAIEEAKKRKVEQQQSVEVPINKVVEQPKKGNAAGTRLKRDYLYTPDYGTKDLIDKYGLGGAAILDTPKGKKVGRPLVRDYVVEEVDGKKSTVLERVRYADIKTNEVFDVKRILPPPDLSKVTTTAAYNPKFRKNSSLLTQAKQDKMKIASVVANVDTYGQQGRRLSAQKVDIASELIGGTGSKKVYTPIGRDAYSRGKGRVATIMQDSKARTARDNLKQQLEGLSVHKELRKTLQQIEDEVSNSGLTTRKQAQLRKKLMAERTNPQEVTALAQRRKGITEARKKFEERLVELQKEGKYNKWLKLAEFRRGRRKGSKNRKQQPELSENERLRRSRENRQRVDTGLRASREARGWLSLARAL